MQELGHAVDLIVVSAMRKLQDLAPKFVEPACSAGQEHLPCLYNHRLRGRTRDLVALGLDSDRIQHMA